MEVALAQHSHSLGSHSSAGLTPSVLATRKGLGFVLEQPGDKAVLLPLALPCGKACCHPADPFLQAVF